MVGGGVCAWGSGVAEGWGERGSGQPGHLAHAASCEGCVQARPPARHQKPHAPCSGVQPRPLRARARGVLGLAPTPGALPPTLRPSTPSPNGSSAPRTLQMPVTLLAIMLNPPLTEQV